MREPLNFILPTWNNEQQLMSALQSILHTGAYYPVRIIVVNNGSAKLESPNDNVTMINTGKNLGWEGGLEEGLKHVTGKYVVFCNDDVFVPRSSFRMFRDMIRTMEMYPEIGAIGPSTNVAMGWQNIWAQPMFSSQTVPFLIGFCLLVRREALEKAGGVDTSAPGGDDIDLSIRLKDAGYTLVCAKDHFIYHHGFQTGIRVHGDPSKPGGWNSPQMTERTNDWLIRKHGFLKWWKTLVGFRAVYEAPSHKDSDIEGEMVRRYIIPGKIVELACGAKKTVPEAIGVDEVPQGQSIELLGGNVSVADIVADVTDDLPFEPESVDTIIGRHIIEHVVDVLDVLTKWAKPLKAGGRLILATPNENIGETIPLNPEHVHAFTPNSLRKLGEAVGLQFVGAESHINGVSFVISFQK